MWECLINSAENAETILKALHSEKEGEIKSNQMRQDKKLELLVSQIRENVEHAAVTQSPGHLYRSFRLAGGQGLSESGLRSSLDPYVSGLYATDEETALAHCTSIPSNIDGDDQQVIIEFSEGSFLNLNKLLNLLSDDLKKKYQSFIDENLAQFCFVEKYQVIRTIS